MSSNYTFINGEFVPFNESTLHVSDLSIQRGYAVFDFLLVKDGVPKFLPFHLDRFINSAALLSLGLNYTKDELSDIVKELVKKNNIRNSSVKIILTGGLSVDDFTLSPVASTLIIINKPFEVKIPAIWKDGAGLITSKYQREIPEAKTINYLNSVRLSQKLVETNAAEVLYIDRNWVRECSRSNIYMVRNGCIYTPKSKVLAGVTRRRILGITGFKVFESDFKFTDLLAADEVFITSTTKGVLPIVTIDSYTISNGRPGSITSAIQKLIMSE